MLDITTREDGVTVISVTAEMTIYNATEIKNKLLAEVRKASDIEVDLSKVNEFDTSGLQILMAISSDCAAADRPYSVSEASPIVEKLIELYNAYEQVSIARGVK